MAEESGHTDTELSDLSATEHAEQRRRPRAAPNPATGLQGSGVRFKKGSLLNMCYKMSLDDYMENRWDEENLEYARVWCLYI